MLDHAQIQRDKGPLVVDDDMTPEKRSGDGEHAMRGLSKGEQLAVGEVPYRKLVLCFLTGPCSDGTKGEAGSQWRMRDEGFGYGL